VLADRPLIEFGSEAAAAFTEALEAPATVNQRLATALARPRKSPMVAAGLAIVPGLGHLYLGEWRKAVAFMGSAGVLAWAARTETQQQVAATKAAKDQLVAGAGAPGTAEAGIVTHIHGNAKPANATPGEKAAAQLLLDQTKLGTQRFQDLQAAQTDGYKAVTPVGEPIVHFVNPAYLVKGDTLNPEHPESLIYGTSAKGPILLAAMYIAHGIGQPGPDIGGPLTLWHAHSNLCFNSRTNIIDAFTDAAGNCPAGSFNSGTPEMLHVWVVDNPNGAFSTDMNPAALVKLLQAGASP